MFPRQTKTGLPTTHYLRKYFTYDPTGDLLHRTGRRAGTSAVTLAGGGQPKVRLRGGYVFLAARVVMKMHDENFLNHYRVGFKDGDIYNITLKNLEIIDECPAATSKALAEKAPPPPPQEVARKPRSKALPSIEQLRSVFHYDPKTGELRWTNKSLIGAPLQGDQLGKPDKLGYRRVHAFGRVMMVHRIAWAIYNGQDPGENLIDHINGNPSDNRIENLRLASYRKNARNTKKLPKSGFRNVTLLQNGTFSANIKIRGHSLYIGTFKEAKVAAAAVARVEKAIDFAMDVPKQDYPEYMI